MSGLNRCLAVVGIVFASASIAAADDVVIEKVLEVSHYCEGVVFDHDGNGYISYHDTIEQFTPDGKHRPWARTGAPNGHKILADGTHLVCDASQHAVLRLDKNGKILGAASWMCDNALLRGPNDLTLDTANGGFYFTDPGGSDDKNPIGTVHYVDARMKTHLVAQGLAYPNGIVLRPGGKELLVAESKQNRILKYEVLSPGRVAPMQVFANLPQKEGEQVDNQPDGICLDVDGNLYVAHYGMKQVQVLNPRGELIARLPGGNLTTSNVAFSGPERNVLYITGGLGKEAGPGGLFRIVLKGTKGLDILPAKN